MNFFAWVFGIFIFTLRYAYLKPVFKDHSRLWQYGLWTFQTGGINIERFLPKNQHNQRNFLNFENYWTNGGPQ